MSNTMRAVQVSRPGGDFELVEREVPTPGPGEELVEWTPAACATATCSPRRVSTPGDGADDRLSPACRPGVGHNDARVGTTNGGTVRAGRRRAERVAQRHGTGRVLLGAVVAVLAAAAWVYLVRVAIAFGRAARTDGGVVAWLLTAVATLGAAACLALVLVLLARGRDALRGRARHGPGRHR